MDLLDLGDFPFFTFDYGLQRELCLRQKSLNRREMALFRQFHAHQTCSDYPSCLPKFTLLDDGQGKEAMVCFDSSLLDQFEVVATFAEGLSLEQTDSAVCALAQFHAFSYKQLDPQNALMPFTRVDTLIEQEVKEWMIETLLHLAPSPTADDATDDYFAKNERALRDFCLETNLAEKEEGMGAKSGAGKFPLVLCHGNFSLENIFFQRESGDERAVLPLIMNWDLAKPGNGLSDLAHLLLSSVQPTDRAQHLDRWLDLYIGTFEQQCQGIKKTKRPKFGPDKPAKQFHSLLPSQLVRILPKLAWEYRKLAELWGKGETRQERQAIAERMTAGFEMIRRDFEH